MTREHLAALLRRYLLDEGSVSAETLARLSDDDVILSCFTSATVGADRPSAEQIDELIASCGTFAHSDESGHAFRRKPAGHSDRKRPPGSSERSDDTGSFTWSLLYLFFRRLTMACYVFAWTPLSG